MIFAVFYEAVAFVAYGFAQSGNHSVGINAIFGLSLYDPFLILLLEASEDEIM